MELPNLIAYGIIAAVAGLALYILLKVGQKLLKVLAVVFLATVGYYFIQGGSATEIRESLEEAWASVSGKAKDAIEGVKEGDDEAEAE